MEIGSRSVPAGIKRAGHFRCGRRAMHVCKTCRGSGGRRVDYRSVHSPVPQRSSRRRSCRMMNTEMLLPKLTDYQMQCAIEAGEELHLKDGEVNFREGI